MLDLIGSPVLDKQSLFGACARLGLNIDAKQLCDEVARLPSSMWGSTGGRVGVHKNAEAVFLRGQAPADGNLPIDDREAIAQLPYTKRIIREVVPALPMRCLLARLPPGGTTKPHIDRAPYFSKTLRLHFPVQTSDSAFMWVSGNSYQLASGEAWVLNNSALHGVWNGHTEASRIHLICDFLPSAGLLSLLAASEKNLGVARKDVDQHMKESSTEQFFNG